MRRFLSLVLLALAGLAATPAAAQISRKISFHNKCSRPIEVTLVTPDSDGDFDWHLGYAVRPGQDAYLSDSRGPISVPDGTPFYFYAEATDGSGARWEDTSPAGKAMEIKGVIYHLRRARPQLIAGGYVVSVTCEYTDKTASSNEPATSAGADDPAKIARLQEALLAFFQKAPRVQIRNFRSNLAGSELWSMQRTITGASSTDRCVLTLVTTLPVQSANVNNPAKTYRLDFSKLTTLNDPLERAVSFRAEHMADGEWGIFVFDDASDARSVAAAMTKMARGCS